MLALERLDPIGSGELDPELIDLLQECREKPDWAHEVAKCRQQYKAVKHRLRPKAESLLKGICYICEGTGQFGRYTCETKEQCAGRLGEEESLCRKAVWQAVVGLYDRAQRILENEGHEYGRGIALMALGLAHQVESQYQEAHKLYERSCQVFEALDQEYKLWHGASEDSPYRKFCRQLSSMIHRTKCESVRPLPLFFFATEARASVLTCLPGEKHPGLIGAAIVDGAQYQLLSLQAREPTEIDLALDKPDQEYLLVTAEGESMIGANILPADKLLVSRQEKGFVDGDIVALQDEDLRPTLRRYRHTADREWLELANPRYKAAQGSRNLRMLGAVKAILKEPKQVDATPGADTHEQVGS